MQLSFLHPFKIKPQEEHPLVKLHEVPDQNTSEGSEFLDDALRMEDMALTPDESKTKIYENVYVTCRSDDRAPEQRL